MINDKLGLRFIGDEVLSNTSEKIDVITEDIKTMAKEMVAMLKPENGVGLAAPQVGKNIKLVVIDLKDMDYESKNTPGEMLLFPQMPIVLINPEITAFSKETDIVEEGCLSVPAIYAPVERPTAVQLKGELLSGEKINVLCGGFLARVLQHEIDHLEGRLFIDRLTEKVLKRIGYKLKKLNKKLAKGR